MSEIYLIRHGQASFGAKNYDVLSPIGIRQASILAEHLFASGISFDAVYSGEMERQKDTAKPFCSRFASVNPVLNDFTIIPAFNEYDASALLIARSRLGIDVDARSEETIRILKTDKKAFQVYFSDTVDLWLAGRLDADPGVERWPHFINRVEAGLKMLMKRHGKGSHIAVFTSGGPISAVMKIVMGLSDRTSVDLSWQVMNASWTCIKYRNDSLALSVFNSVSHLMLEKEPELITYR